MTMMNRSLPDAAPTLAFTSAGNSSARPSGERQEGRTSRKIASTYLVKSQGLAAIWRVPSDPPPGNMVIWRGLSRLTDIDLGFTMGAELVGN